MGKRGRLEVNKPSWLKPSWRPYHHGGRDMRSSTRGLLEVALVGYFAYKTLVFSDFLVTVVYATIILMSEHTHNMHIRWE